DQYNTSWGALRSPSFIHTVLPAKGKLSMRPITLFLLAVGLFVSPSLAQKRSITEKDLFSFVWVADPQISPDGSQIAFVKVTVNEKKDGYNTAIWSVSTAFAIRPLAGPPMASIWHLCALLRRMADLMPHSCLCSQCPVATLFSLPV